jgi:hypothetical protein
MKSSVIMIFIMFFVFFTHKYFVYESEMTPWKGGGFAMYSEPHFNKRVIYSEGTIVSSGKEHRFSHKEEPIIPYVVLQNKIKLYPSPSNLESYSRMIKSLGRYKNKKGDKVSFQEEKEPYMKEYKLIIYDQFLDLENDRMFLRKVKEFKVK